MTDLPVSITVPSAARRSATSAGLAGLTCSPVRPERAGPASESITSRLPETFSTRTVRRVSPRASASRTACVRSIDTASAPIAVFAVKTVRALRSASVAWLSPSPATTWICSGTFGGMICSNGVALMLAGVEPAATQSWLPARK